MPRGYLGKSENMVWGTHHSGCGDQCISTHSGLFWDCSQLPELESSSSHDAGSTWGTEQADQQVHERGNSLGLPM